MAEYSYLNGMSDESKALIVKRIEEGKLNLYNSIMSVLGYRMKSGEFTSELIAEKEYYKKKNKKKLEDIDEKLFDEIYEYIFFKFQGNRLRDNGSPIATKDERTIAKGAMVMALKKCNVSDKNIQGMLGVMNQLLLTTSAFDLKKAFHDYSKHL